LALTEGTEYTEEFKDIMPTFHRLLFIYTKFVVKIVTLIQNP